jgi:hypothetical protein
MDHILHDPSHPRSPTNPFEFPFTLASTPPTSLQPQTTAHRTNPLAPRHLIHMPWLFLPCPHPLTMRTFHLLQNHLPRSRRVLSWTTFSMTRHVPDLRQTHSNSHLLSPLPHPTSLLPRMVGLYFEVRLSQISLRSWIASTHVIGSPHVFGLRHDSSSYVCVRKTSTSLLDAGANICLTGNLQHLVDVVEIPPLPISVAITGDAPSLDVCCTIRVALPLQISTCYACHA